MSNNEKVELKTIIQEEDNGLLPETFNYIDDEKSLSSRYGIAEWYGKDILIMQPAERKKFAEIALKINPEKPICPFMSTLNVQSKCNKIGGVCTLRKYRHIGKNRAAPEAGKDIVTICPSRFLGVTKSGNSVLSWVAKTMIDDPKAILIKETPFLRKLLAPERKKERISSAQIELIVDSLEEIELTPSVEEKKAGRIDWLLLNSNSENDNDPNWCALETQAVYFSGDNMGLEFTAYLNSPSEIIFPKGFRRPDYRSSGPKRLAPQLSVKVPVLRGWGKKVAVLVDKYFFDSMHELPDAYKQGKNDEEKRDNSEVSWFIVNFDEEMKLTFHNYHFSTLDGSIAALNATAPMSKNGFNADLKKILTDKKKLNKKYFRT